MGKNDQTIQRRDFLRIGAGITAGALVGCAGAGRKEAAGPQSAAAAGTPPAAPAASPPRPANRRVLGRTGIEVPVVSMGVMNADNPNLVRAALEGGMFLLDTAHGYQNGRNEEMIGTVVRGRRRESFVLCTKVFVSTLDRKTGLFSPNTRPQEIQEKLDISLGRLGLDHVDVLYLHNQTTRDGALYAPILEALQQVQRAGKARFIGVSTHKNEPEVIRAAIEAKVYDVVLTSYNFRQDHHQEVQKAIGEAAAAGLGVVAMKTQAGVFWDEAKAQPIDMKAALRWALRDPNVHTAIPGFTTIDQLNDDLAVLASPQLTDEDRAKLDRPAKVAGFYCQGCEECLTPCRAGLPIPDLMRGYMYAHAYRNREAAQRLVLDLGLPGDPCGDCDECLVRCAKGFDVRARIRDVVRLRDVPPTFFI